MTTKQNEAQHTPTPWAVSAMGTGNIVGDSGRRLVANCAGHQNNITAEQVAAENDANAELIVRAVNSHAALVEALEAAREHLEWIGYGDSYERDCARGDGLATRIATALAGAKGTP